MPNPYLSSALFVGRDSQLAQVAGILKQGRSVLLIGGRRAGKSTLARQLTTESVNRTLIRTDVAGWDLRSEAAALGALLSAVQRKQETVHIQATRYDVAVALHTLRPTALVIDEADRLLLAHWGPSFFSFLRWLDDTYLREDIAILLLGGPVLTLFRDPDDKGSPPLNTAEPKFLDPLDRTAVAELAVHVPGADVKQLMDHGGGHAWLTTRLLAALYDGTPFDEALDDVFDLAASTFPVWERQLGEAGRKLLRELPEQGLTREDLRRVPWSKHREAARLSRSVGALRYEDSRLSLGPRLFTDWLLDRDPDQLVWDLAISYASEDEALARQIYGQLRNEFRIFYAPEQDAALWGTDLMRCLPNTYGVQSRYVLVLSTPVYVTKHWTRIEYDSVTAKAPERILLLDCGRLPEHLPQGLVYRGSSAAELIGLTAALREKLIA